MSKKLRKRLVWTIILLIQIAVFIDFEVNSMDRYAILTSEESPYYFKVFYTKGDCYVSISEDLELLRNSKVPTEDMNYIKVDWTPENETIIFWYIDSPERIISFRERGIHSNSIQIEKFVYPLRGLNSPCHDEIWIGYDLNPKYQGLIVVHDWHNLKLMGWKGVKVIEGRKFVIRGTKLCDVSHEGKS